MDQNKKNPNNWKDYAGIAVCSITVLAFIAIGFIIMAAKTAGVDVAPPGDWMAAMLSLASTALGWLAGQKLHLLLLWNALLLQANFAILAHTDQVLEGRVEGS